MVPAAKAATEHGGAKAATAGRKRPATERAVRRGRGLSCAGGASRRSLEPVLAAWVEGVADAFADEDAEEHDSEEGEGWVEHKPPGVALPGCLCLGEEFAEAGGGDGEAEAEVVEGGEGADGADEGEWEEGDEGDEGVGEDVPPGDPGP